MKGKGGREGGMFECLFHSLCFTVSLSLSVSPGRVTNGSEAVANFAIDSDKRERARVKEQKAKKSGTKDRHDRPAHTH